MAYSYGLSSVSDNYMILATTVPTVAAFARMRSAFVKSAFLRMRLRPRWRGSAHDALARGPDAGDIQNRERKAQLDFLVGLPAAHHLVAGHDLDDEIAGAEAQHIGDAVAGQRDVAVDDQRGIDARRIDLDQAGIGEAADREAGLRLLAAERMDLVIEKLGVIEGKLDSHIEDRNAHAHSHVRVRR